MNIHDFKRRQKTYTAYFCGITACFLLFLNVKASASEVWLYEWRDAPQGSTTAAVATDGYKHWIVTEFESDPYPEQLKALRNPANAQRVSLLFKRPPPPALENAFIELARSWKTQGIEGQLKFIGTLPTEDEAKMLRQTCDLGLKVAFISNAGPSTREAANLQTLKDCVEVSFVLGRYLKYTDVRDFKPLAGVYVTLVNNYFPVYAHIDNLNILDSPVALRVTDSVASRDQITLLNMIKKLTGFFWEIQVVPMPEQYAALEALDRSPARRLGLRWVFGPPRREDLDAWIKLQPSRVQLSRQAFDMPGVEAKLSLLRGEVIVETFDVTKAGP